MGDSLKSPMFASALANLRLAGEVAGGPWGFVGGPRGFLGGAPDFWDGAAGDLGWAGDDVGWEALGLHDLSRTLVIPSGSSIAGIPIQGLRGVPGGLWSWGVAPKSGLYVVFVLLLVAPEK